MEGSALDGRCDDGCGGGKLGLFLVIMAVELFLIFVLHIPDVIITIRYVCLCNSRLSTSVPSVFICTLLHMLS